MTDWGVNEIDRQELPSHRLSTNLYGSDGFNTALEKTRQQDAEDRRGISWWGQVPVAAGERRRYRAMSYAAQESKSANVRNLGSAIEHLLDAIEQAEDA